MKKLCYLVSIPMILVLLAACGEAAEQPEQNEQDNSIPVMSEAEAVATVNGDIITSTQYNSLLDYSKRMYEQQGLLEGEEGQEMIQLLEEEILDQLISQKLLVQKALEEGLEAEEGEVSEQIAMISAQYETEEQLQTALEQEGLSITILEHEIKNEIVINKLIEQISSEIDVSEEEVQSQYEAMAEMMEDEIPPYEEYSGELKEQLVGQKINTHLSELLSELREAAEIEIHL